MQARKRDRNGVQETNGVENALRTRRKENRPDKREAGGAGARKI